MPGRLPFHYGPGCSGPVVSIGDIPFLPICSFPAYVQPTLALHHVNMTLPDLAPPPLCPCIFTVKARPFSINYPGYIGNPGASGSLVFKPSMPMNCCEPTFKMSGRLNLPCMPFAVSAFCRINIGSMHCTLVKLSHCHLKFSTYISLPSTFSCIPFSIGAKFSVTPPSALKGFFFGKDPSHSCKLKFSVKLSLPSPSCIKFSVANGPDTINIGTFSFVLSAVPASCKLKQHGKISLPCTWVTAVNSVSYDGTNFKCHYRLVKVFTFQPVQQTTWATAEPCPAV